MIPDCLGSATMSFLRVFLPAPKGGVSNIYREFTGVLALVQKAAYEYLGNSMEAGHYTYIFVSGN